MVLSQMDRLIASDWIQRFNSPVVTVGSSIGAWRFAALGSDSPISAIEAFEDAYIAQSYQSRPTAADVTRESVRILEAFLSESSTSSILSHPVLRSVIVTVRSRSATASDWPPLLGTGLLLAAAGNAIDRRLLALFFERSLFFDPRTEPPLVETASFGFTRTPLDVSNFKDVLLASGSIPLVMSGVRGISGAPTGTYRDGGVMDYHLDIPFAADDQGIVLYPHYTDRVIPGWFDKRLKWRASNPKHMANVVLICPSRTFIERLPHGKIPDRNDFFRFRGDDPGRVAYWREVVNAGRAMADELAELVESGRIRQAVQPLSR